MYSLASLVDGLPQISQARMVAGGIGVWMAWSGQLNKAFNQTLKDYGGIRMAEEGNQALWFFIDKQVFRGLSRLNIWAKLNPVAVFFETFPSTLLVGWNMETSLSVPAETARQTLVTPSDFTIYVHPKLFPQVEASPGMSLAETPTIPGMAHLTWKGLTSDASFAFESGLAWYFIIKPVGNSFDKEFIAGWRAVSKQAERTAKRLGLKYLFGENSFILLLENLRQLNGCCREFIQQIKAAKGKADAGYWPCVMVAVAREKLPFNDELVTKVNLDWKRLVPDYPHLAYRTAFLLGSEFRINEIGYFNEKAGIDNWCTVALATSGADQGDPGCLQIQPSRVLMQGDATPCFFCGQKNHGSRQCPSRMLTEVDAEVWGQLARFSLDDFSQAAQELDDALKGGDLALMAEMLGQSGKGAVMLRAAMEIGWAFQPRMIGLLWRCRNKDWPGAFEHLAPEEGEFIWEALSAFRTGDLASAEQLLGSALIRFARNYQPRALAGLVAYEKGDLNQAMFYMQEAERLSYTAVQRAVLLVLQGRILEIGNEFDKAVALYRRAEQQAPAWLDTIYRQGVCQVKMGFSEHAMAVFTDLVRRDPDYFNRLLVDPELERGRVHLMSGLWEVWQTGKARAEEAKASVEELKTKLGLWFTAEHEFMESGAQRVERLAALTGISNYVAFIRLSQGVGGLERDLQERVETEIAGVKEKVDGLSERLVNILKDASWFPFPKLLREFNQDFNACAEKLNWMKTQHLAAAENFRKGQIYLADVEERIKRLQGRLVTLRIIRDSTFFMLLLGRNFVWMELAGLGLALIIVPLVMFLANRYSAGWISDLMLQQKWQLQKGLIIILSIVAMAASAVKTAITFEKKKEKLFAEEYEKAMAESVARKQRRIKAANGRAASRARPAKAK